jgi:hypothetical protein
MLKLDLQLFASKKGVGSTITDATANRSVWARNVQTAKSLLRAAFSSVNAERKFTQVTT